MARSDGASENQHPVTCESCGSESTVDNEARRRGGVIECPICGTDIDLDAAFEDGTGGDT